MASESKIAQMFGKKLANENVSNKGMSPDTDKGMSPNIRDEDYLNEEDFKAFLAGMEPDQDVSKALDHSGEAVDGSSRNAIPNSSSPLKELPRDGSESKANCLSKTVEEEESAISSKEHGRDISRSGPIGLKSSPVSTPVKPQARKASPVVKDNDVKRQRTNDASKDSSRKALDAGVKQKQSNLLGFFSKQ